MALILLVALAETTQAQEDSDFHPGYIVSHSHDTVSGFVKYYSNYYQDIMNEIRFRKTPDASRKTYRPTDIAGYFANGRTFRSFKPPGFTEATFLELIIDGSVNLYRRTYPGIRDFETGRRSNPNDEKIEFVQKAGEELVQIQVVNFKKRMARYFADNEELSNEIRRGYYKWQDIEQIVWQYNKAAK